MQGDVQGAQHRDWIALILNIISIIFWLITIIIITALDSLAGSASRSSDVNTG